MGVSADSAASVTFESAGSERTLLVGKSGPGYGTAYVRLPDQDAVYLADGGFRTHIVRAFDAWRDSRIVAVDTAAVERVQVRRADAEYVVARADSAWIVDDDEPADPAAVRNILAELADLRGSGFLADADSVAMQPAALWVTALGASGDTLAAVSIGAGAGDRWARSRGDSVIYRLSSWRIDRLAPMHEALRGS